MLDLKRVTLFAIHVAFDKTKTEAQVFKMVKKKKHLTTVLKIQSEHCILV